MWSQKSSRWLLPEFQVGSWKTLYGIPTWGDGKITGSEAWDDQNTTNGDGCSYQGWSCYSKLVLNQQLLGEYILCLKYSLAKQKKRCLFSILTSLIVFQKIRKLQRLAFCYMTLSKADSRRLWA